MDVSTLSDIQSESGVIGTLIYHPEFILNTDYLKPQHFYDTVNGSIYWAIRSLYDDGITTIDAYNLSTKINSDSRIKGTFDQYNMPPVQQFVELFKKVARTTQKEYILLANNIVELSFRRDLIKDLNNLNNTCYDKKLSLDQLSNTVYTSIDSLTMQYVTQNDVDVLGNQIDSIWEEIVNRRTADGLYGMPSKYPELNQYFTYEPGELVIVKAKMKAGKSMFLMNEAVHKLQNGVPVLVFDTEMPTRQYTERLISLLSGVEMRRVKNGQYSQDEANRIEQSIKWIKAVPLTHIYDPFMTDESFFTVCKMVKHKTGLGFLVYDYIKSNETSTGDNYNVLGQKTDFLKNRIAGEFNIPVLAAAQLNRQNDVADSSKIDRYLSVSVKWEMKTQELIDRDGPECGNARAVVDLNRLGPPMDTADPNDYIDFIFDGSRATIAEAKQHGSVPRGYDDGADELINGL